MFESYTVKVSFIIHETYEQNSEYIKILEFKTQKYRVIVLMFWRATIPHLVSLHIQTTIKMSEMRILQLALLKGEMKFNKKNEEGYS